jgi:phage shock protein PspC (stress-responsive transcriptional regulator)
MEKKLQRDPQNKVIGGVCAGLANYFGIDASLVRLLFAIAFFVFSSGLWIYLLLWIVMPVAQGGKAEANYYASPDGTVEASSEETTDVVKEPIQNKGSLIAGLILIGIGAFGLLHQYIPEINWSTIWPICLILFGIFLIVPKNRKS